MGDTGSRATPDQLPLSLRPPRPDRSPTLLKRLDEIRAGIVDRLWLSLLVVVLVGVPLSVLRATVTGWLPLYRVHIMIGVLVVCVFFARRRLSTTLKVGVIVGVFWVVGLAGLFTTGLVGASLWWLSLSVLLVTALYSVRAGMLAALVMLVTVALAGAGYVQGWLTLPFDANAYIRTPSAWGGIMVAVVLLPLLVFSTVASFHSSTLQLLEEVDAQHELVRQMANHDELTGVPTLRLAMDRLEQAMLGAARSGGRVALLFIDLDGFKAINDTHGHDAGDAVLKAVAARCSHLVRADDTIARWGGDEFIAVLKEVEGPAAAVALARRILDSLAAPVDYGGQSLRIGASIGVALFPEHAYTAAGMIRAGDGAMYEAKRSGTNQIRVAPPLKSQASA